MQRVQNKDLDCHGPVNIGRQKWQNGTGLGKEEKEFRDIPGMEL